MMHILFIQRIQYNENELNWMFQTNHFFFFQLLSQNLFRINSCSVDIEGN